jgi:hypothetical protein
MKKECLNRDFNKIKKILKIGMILSLENPVNLVKIVVQTKITVQTMNQGSVCRDVACRVSLRLAKNSAFGVKSSNVE